MTQDQIKVFQASVANTERWSRFDQDLSYPDRHYRASRGDILLAEFNEKLCGYLRLEYLWSKQPYIGLIIVDPDSRRKGIGAALLAGCEQQLRSRGYGRLFSSSQSNEPKAQAWHRANGFREAGSVSWLNEDGSNEVFFYKDLG